MKNHRIVFSALLLMIFLVLNVFPEHLAFISVPVAECVGQPLAPLYPHESVEEAYHNIPLSWAGETNDVLTCPRIRQLLFNEVVLVIKQEGQEVFLAVPNMLYVHKDGKKISSHCWTLRKNVTFIDELHSYGLSVDGVPEPINTGDIDSHNQQVVTLISPFFDVESGKIFSAGTRFVYTQVRNGYYSVLVFDEQLKQYRILNIPGSYCLVTSDLVMHERINLFASLIQRWAHLYEGVIPFVWGGSSFVECFPNNVFLKQEKILKNGHMVEYWIRGSEALKAGFDASGLIWRAAQICGIPYYYVNSRTAAAFLKPLVPTDVVLDGDLLWIPHGLFVISDVKNNKIAGSFGYQTGYGRLVELPLNSLFEDIYTYHDLLRHYAQQLPLHIKDAHGSSVKVVKEFKILKMDSVFE